MYYKKIFKYYGVKYYFKLKFSGEHLIVTDVTDFSVLLNPADVQNVSCMIVFSREICQKKLC